MAEEPDRKTAGIAAGMTLPRASRRSLCARSAATPRPRGCRCGITPSESYAIFGIGSRRAVGKVISDKNDTENKAVILSDSEESASASKADLHSVQDDICGGFFIGNRIRPSSDRVNSSNYWSSTTNANNPNNAWNVNFNNGNVNNNNKNNNNYVRCVRGGK